MTADTLTLKTASESTTSALEKAEALIHALQSLEGPPEAIARAASDAATSHDGLANTGQATEDPAIGAAARARQALTPSPRPALDDRENELVPDHQPLRVAKPVGYQRLRQTQAAWPPAGKTEPGWQPPKPLPKRPTGRLYVGALLVCICVAMVWHVWKTFFSVAAAGLVTGDTVVIGSPWDARVVQVHVTQGQSVSKGDLLISLDKAELARALDRLQDEVRVEQAKLDAESARLRQEAHAYTAQAHAYTAQYFQMWATLQKSREELLRMQQDLEHIQSVGDAGVISRQAYSRLVYAESGQREFVDKTTQALEALRQRTQVEGAPSAEASTAAQLGPIQARIDYLNGEIRRTRDEIREGELRSPVNGVVANCQAVCGQTVTSHSNLLEIIDRESLAIELFVPQSEVERYVPGKQITLAIAPHERPLVCTVVGKCNQFEAAPHAIQQFYSDRDTLMPVILAPSQNESMQQLVVGSVAKYSFVRRLLDK